MKKVSSRSPRKKAGQITVHMGDDCAEQSRDSFTLCPLGLQFYSSKPVNEFDLFEFNLGGASASRGKTKTPVKCTGAVVRCQEEKESSRYRVWIQFLDLPQETREKLRCVARKGKHLCSYCENF